MTAQPIHSPDPEDPAEILRRLPGRWHTQFLTEYRAALEAAHEVWQWQQLRVLLHRWRLRATAYADPQFEQAAQEARQARPEDLTSLPGWTNQQVARHVASRDPAARRKTPDPARTPRRARR